MRALLTVGLLAALSVSLGAQNAALKVGDQAPNFKLQASDGKTYQLSDFKGEQAVVIAWFPRAFTQGCTIECKSLAAHGTKIREYDVAYFMASVDALDLNTKFAAENKADFPLLSDPTKETATAYGVLSPAGFSQRWTFYIDKGCTFCFSMAVTIWPMPSVNGLPGLLLVGPKALNTASAPAIAALILSDSSRVP
jgi:peroxiredoxin Q/BCP